MHKSILHQRLQQKRRNPGIQCLLLHLELHLHPSPEARFLYGQVSLHMGQLLPQGGRSIQTAQIIAQELGELNDQAAGIAGAFQQSHFGQ
ncbi:hypothetical protein D3C76_1015310 [compost metagenome]